MLFSVFNLIAGDEMLLSKALFFKLNKMIKFTIVNVFPFLIRCGKRNRPPFTEITYENQKCWHKRQGGDSFSIIWPTEVSV